MAGRGEFTFAGAFDDSFDEYSEVVRHVPGAIVDPLVDRLAPDEGHEDAPFMGTVGAFTSTRGRATPLGPWDPDYMGNVPTSEQPQIPGRDPWTIDE